MGYRVFPITPGKKAPPLCKWADEATTDAGRIGDWWDKTPDANIGLAMGEGVFVLDVDGPGHGVDGRRTLGELSREIGDLPTDALAYTPGGGLHVYMQGDARNSAGALGEGLDIRGEGGYVLAPPSIIDGKRYRWNGGKLMTPPAAPVALMQRLQASSAATVAVPAAGAQIPRGQQDHALFAMARQAFEAGLSLAAVEAAVWTAMQTQCDDHDQGNPWTKRDAHRIAESASTRHSKLEAEMSRRVIESGGTVNAAQPDAPRWTKMSAAELAQLPEVEFVVTGCLVRGVNTLVAASNAGKSLLLLDWSLCMATGQKWLGVDVAAGQVCYVTSEGVPGIHKRMVAWQKRTKVDLPGAEGFYVIPEQPNLADERSVESICEYIAEQGAPRLIAIDTLANATVDLDENSPEMRRAMVAIQDIQARFDCAVVVTQHTGWDNKTRMRGHSSQLGPVDQSLTLQEIEGGTLKLFGTKSRDGERLHPIYLRKEIVVTREAPGLTDEDQTSVYLDLASEPAADAPEDERASLWLAKMTMAHPAGWTRSNAEEVWQVSKSSARERIAKLDLLGLIASSPGNQRNDPTVFREVDGGRLP